MRIIISILLIVCPLFLWAQFTPTELQPKLWLDASDSANLQLNGTKVIQWLDKSGNENHASSPVEVNQPEFVSLKQGIQFDGVDDGLLSSNFSYGENKGITVFAVAKSDLPSEHTKRWIVSKGKWTGSAPFGILQNYNGLHAQMAGKQIIMNYDDQKMHVLTQIIDSTEMWAVIDGISYDKITTELKSNNHNISIGSGSENDKLEFGFKGRICEVIIYQRTLDLCEIDLVNAYLAHKWVEANLNNDHLFHGGPIGVCGSGAIFDIDENSAEGTVVGTLNLVSVSGSEINASNWSLSGQTINGAFGINSASGEIKVADASKIDFELMTVHQLTVSAKVNGSNQNYNITVNINDVEDQGSAKSTSLLWGENGELWDSRGRLPSFAYAGYDAGNSIRPVYTDTINVLDHGVIADDDISDVDAIDAIIKSAPSNRVIFFPAGKYVIDKWLDIERSNIVLAGAGDGADGTVFYMPNSATDINDGVHEGSYAAGDYGYMIEFNGGHNSRVTEITEEALRCDRIIVVKDAKHLHVGDVIEIYAQGDNPVNGALWHEYFNKQAYDWQAPFVSWATGDGGSMFHTIEKIDGNIITLLDPLRLNIKPTWIMFVGKRNSALRNVGFENIRIDFIEKEHASHLDEPGYNALEFNSCFNFWCDNITINNCDNGVYLKGSAYGNINDVTLIGREGHHAFKLGYCANNVVSDINFKTTLPYTHSVTFIHKANGNVLRNVNGDNVVSLDFHRNAPFSNLMCDVRSEWSHASSGAGQAGPHGGARNIYWGLYGEADAIYWGQGTTNAWGKYQNTIVSGLKVNEIFTEEQEWYEDVPNLAEKDLYEAQRRHRFSFVPDSIFADDEIGNRNNWTERDFSRWKIEEVNDEKYYSLIVKDLPKVSQGRVSEYATFTIPEKDTFEVKVNANCIKGFNTRKESDLVLLTSFVDDGNYIFGRISTKDYKTGIYEVVNGRTFNLANGNRVLESGEEKVLKLSIEGDQIAFTMNDTLIALASNVENMPHGIIGIGSSKNGVLFDNITVSGSVSAYIPTYPTAVSRLETENNIHVYPNPVADVLRIETKANEVAYSILNINAQLVRSGLGKKIDFSNLEEGMYIIRIELPGETPKSFKVIKANQ